MADLEYVEAADITSADLGSLTRLTQEAEAAIGLVDMTVVRLAKLFESLPGRRGCVVCHSGVPAGRVAVRVDGCTGVLTADQAVFGSGSASLRDVIDIFVDLHDGSDMRRVAEWPTGVLDYREIDPKVLRTPAPTLEVVLIRREQQKYLHVSLVQWVVGVSRPAEPLLSRAARTSCPPCSSSRAGW